MSTFLILGYALCSTALFFQIVGLILLHWRKSHSRNKNQIYLLIALFHTESAYLARSILYFIILSSVELLWCLDIYLVILYYFFMIMLTLDRFLAFYWNIKYPIYFRPKKLLKILYSIVAFTTIFVLILVLVIHFKKIAFSSVNTVALPLYIIFDCLYLLIVVITYTYIFVVFKRQMKLRKTSGIARKSHNHFRFIVPTLIIATFILFNIFPNFLSLFIGVHPPENYNTDYGIRNIIYVLGWVVDPLIYLGNLYFMKCRHKRH